MLGMCGRRQREKKPVFNPTHRALSIQTQARFVIDYTLWHEYKRCVGVFNRKSHPSEERFYEATVQLFAVEHPAEVQMVCSVVGGTVERSAAGRRRSMNRRLGPSLGALPTV